MAEKIDRNIHPIWYYKNCTAFIDPKNDDCLLEELPFIHPHLGLFMNKIIDDDEHSIYYGDKELGGI